MPSDNLAVGFSYTAQMITAAVMALLLYGFYRQYRKDYLLHWTLSWSALALNQFAIIVALTSAIHANAAAHHLSRLVPSVIANTAAYLHVGWMLFGVYELLRRRPVRLRESTRVLYLLGGVGAVTALLFIWPSAADTARHLARGGIYGVLALVAFGGAAVALWRARRPEGGIGPVVLSIAMFVHALQQIQNAVVRMMTISYGLRTVPSYLVFVDLISLPIMALGMIACLLEDERESAELAAGQIEHLAYHDALTGLPNRPLFMDRLIISVAQAARANQKLAVLFLDLDRFKEINDSLGHSVGDTLLKGVAERIRHCVREGDTVARFGGDEFTLLIPKIDNIEDAAKIAQKIIETLRIPFAVSATEMFVTTSIGVSIYPSDGLDPETLVRNADTAMYRAKENGRDSYQLYTPAMNARAVERLELESTLRKAITQKDLLLHYQPLINARTEEVIGVEALIRWKHRERGILSPAHFISLAEVSGLIVPIGDWVLREACRQIRAWRKPLGETFTVAVNLSARQFQQPDLVEQIRSAIEEARIEPSTLEVEITESSAMQNAENTIYTLRELKALGVRISMDDFGTGYSSLNYLKRFPIDTLKLDQMFVRDVNTDPRNAAIINAMIMMAHSLDLKVVAEGVEEEAQLEFLRKLDCDIIQGYYYAAPMPADELERFVTSRKSRGIGAA
jgi:diguanylate cyclase (GGDEF)-like protein